MQNKGGSIPDMEGDGEKDETRDEMKAGFQETIAIVDRWIDSDDWVP